MSEAPRGYLRFPSIRGQLVAFAAQDDVWLAPTTPDAARAWRLTDDRAPVADVALSPDGAAVAYTCALAGVPEVHVVDVEGGGSRRITWWGDPFVHVLGWTADGRVVAASATGEPFRSRTWAWAVPTDGSPAQRLPYGPLAGLAVSPTGAVAVATGQGRRDYAWWKRYRGGTASRLWIDEQGSGQFAPLATGVGGSVGGPLVGQVAHPMWVAGRLAFASDHEGHGNLYSCLPDGTDLRRHTDHEEFWVRQPSSDGQRIVYAAGGQLWMVDDLAPDAQPRPLPVRTGGPRAGRAPSMLPAGEVAAALHEARPDLTGRASVVEVRGTLHWVTTREGPVRVIAAQAGSRARLPRLLGPAGPSNHAQRVVWVSDASGEDALHVADVSAVGDVSVEPVRLAAGQLGRVLDLAAAPDGSLAAVASHDGRLLVVDIASGAVRVVATTTDDAPRDLAFSPDSRWLAWSAPGPEPRSAVRMARLGPGGGPDVVLDVTDDRFTDTEPVFTLDGSHLALLSRRTFDPVYDEHVFDLSFPVAARPHLVPLAAATASPFDPELGGRPTTAPDDAAAHASGLGDEASAAAALTSGAAELVVDTEHLPARLVPVPVPAAWYSNLRAVEGGLVWLRQDLHGQTGQGLRPGAPPPRPVLERLDLATGRTLVLATGVDGVEVTGDGKRLLVQDGDELRLVPSTAPVDDDDADSPHPQQVVVDTDRVRVRLDPPAQWRQMFEETWRLMRDHFWVADLADVDWSAVRERYAPLLEGIATLDDLVDVLWEVNGELGTSHAYVRPPPRPDQAEHQVGFLGADLVRIGGTDGADPRWVVARVLAGESSDAAARSPLAAPAAVVTEGEVLLAVDGRAVDPVTGPGPLLVGTAGKPVELLLGPTPAAGSPPRRVVVVPLEDDMPLRYQDWVAGRRAAVREASGGRAGYLHVPDMVSSGWAQLHRDLRTEVARDALVLDVRDNSGGHTSQLVVERLARRVLAWGVGRGWQPETYPSDARRGPLVALTDANAGSDGDIVTAVVQQLGLGPVVGTRTWGGVVGIDARFRLVDGTLVTQPRYAFWFPGPGWGVENHGVDPDVEVPFPPQAWVAGTDPQLERGVELLMSALASSGVATAPDVATRPSRRPPPLPPRPPRSSGPAPQDPPAERTAP